MKHILALCLAATLMLAASLSSFAQQTPAAEPEQQTKPAFASQEDVDAAKKRFNAALKKPDWPAVYEVAQGLAEHGDAEAQGVLGIIYYEGLSVTQDSKRASEWLTKSVAQGFASAEALLGRVELELGNYDKAEPHLEKTAKEGNSVSMLLLASLYGNAPGDRRDPSKSMYWLVKAGARYELARKTIANLFPVLRPGEELSEAEREKFVGFFEEAARSAETADIMLLGQMYETGQTVKTDLDAALQWYGIAARQGDTNGQVKFADTIIRFKQEGKPIEKELARLRGDTQNVEDGDEGKIMTQIAVDHLYSAAAQGSTAAMGKIGQLYVDDDVLPRDLESAYAWLLLGRLAAERDGQSVDQDLEAVVKAVETEILNDDAGGQSALANATRRGRKHDRDNTLPDKPRVLAANSKRLVVAGDSVNLRRGPGTNNEVVMNLDTGEEVLELAMVDGWSQVQTLGAARRVGWVSSGLLRHKHPERGGSRSELVVTGSDVDVRATPAQDGLVFLRVANGQRGTELERRGDWVRVRLQDKDQNEGWINKSFLSWGTVRAPGDLARPTQQEATETAQTNVQDAPPETATETDLLPQPTDSETQFVTSAGGVNVRSGPGLDGTIAFKLEAGTLVQVLARQGSWTEVSVPDANSQRGWIRSDLLGPDFDVSGSANNPTGEESANVGLSGNWLVDRPRVNLRAAPSVQSEALGSLTSGTSVLEVSRQDDWIEVEIPGDTYATGWLYRPLLRATGGQPAQSAADGLRILSPGVNLRAGPGTQYGVIQVIEQGAPIGELSRQADWVEIMLVQSGVAGWVHTEFVSGTEDITSGAAQAPSSEVGDVTQWAVVSSQVQVRRDPSSSSPIVVTLGEGQRVTATGRQNNWLRILHSEIPGAGWAPVGDLALVDEREAAQASSDDSAAWTVAADSIRVRSGAGTEYRVVGGATQGDQVFELERSDNDWLRVRLADGTEGWVYSPLLSR